MTDPLELLIREDLAAIAGETPLAQDLAGSAMRRAQVHRRRHAIRVTAGALVVALALGTAALLAGRGSVGSVPPVTRPSPNTQQLMFDGLLSYRGAAVPVPKAWLDPANVPCGTAVRDAAYIRDPETVVLLCDQQPRKPAGEITEVVLAPWDYRWIRPLPGSGEHLLPDGRTQLATRVPAADLRFVVTSPDPDLARRIFDGLVVNASGPCSGVRLSTSGGDTVHVTQDRTAELSIAVGETVTGTTSGPCSSLALDPQPQASNVLTTREVPSPDEFTSATVLTGATPGTVRVTVFTAMCDGQELACAGGVAIQGSVDITVVAGP